MERERRDVVVLRGGECMGRTKKNNMKICEL